MKRLNENNFNVGDVKIKRGIKSTITDIEPETGRITWDLSKSPELDTTFKAFNTLNNFFEKISNVDPTIERISTQVNKLFNEYRTHMRKNYKDDYARVKSIAETSATGGESYLTKNAFKPKYKYRLKKVNESSLSTFQQNRLKTFDKIEDTLNSLSPLIANAKQETTDYYAANPGTYEITYSADLILNYLQDIKKLLNTPQ
jgi:hypothetical protein